MKDKLKEIDTIKIKYNEFKDYLKYISDILENIVSNVSFNKNSHIYRYSVGVSNDFSEDVYGLSEKLSKINTNTNEILDDQVKLISKVKGECDCASIRENIAALGNEETYGDITVYFKNGAMAPLSSVNKDYDSQNHYGAGWDFSSFTLNFNKFVLDTMKDSLSKEKFENFSKGYFPILYKKDGKVLFYPVIRFEKENNGIIFQLDKSYEENGGNPSYTTDRIKKIIKSVEETLIIPPVHTL